MRKNESPKCTQLGLLMFLLLILGLASSLGLVGCGGGSSSSNGGGGGGGGGGNVLPCTFNAPSAGGTTSGTGVGKQIDNEFFGMHLNSQRAPWPFFSFGSQRIWDAGVAWSQVNTAQGVYGWTTAPQNMDVWMSDAQAHGVNTLYTLARTPTWASSDPTSTSCIDNSNNGPGQCAPPTELDTQGGGTDATWISWVTAAAQYSAAKKAGGEPGFDHYEIWNEWNSSVFWSGTTQQLVRMEQDARCVVEGPPAGMSCNPNSSFPSGMAIDPGAKIVSPSPVGAHPKLSAVADSLSSYFSTTVQGHAGGEFSDVIGFHGYVGTGTKAGNTALPCPTPEDVNTVIADMNGTLNNFPAMLGKPLFNTEGGWSEADVEGFTDQDRQAAFLPRYLLLQQSANISRVYWYAWDSKKLSSLYNDSTGQATLAATAYGEVNKWTVGATVSKACGANGAVWTCGFTRPGGYSALAVWDAGQDCTASSCPSPTTFQIPAGGYIEYRDVAGNVTQLGTGTSVQIGAKPILLETAPLP